MFKISLLSFIFLLILVVTSDLKAVDVIPSTESSVVSTNTFCRNALQENKYFAETEAQMRERRFSDYYVAGLDHVMESLRLAESLRARSINPYTTHIPEFAELIDLYINFIERGIRYQRYSSEADRLKLLQLFKAEGQQRKNTKTVTYRWWFNFNLRLSVLASPRKTQMMTNANLEYLYANWRRDEHYADYSTVSALLDRFPERIMLPTIQDLGIMSINKTYGTGVHFIGLKNHSTYVDGRRMSPYRLFKEDIFRIRKKNITDSPRFTFSFQQKLVGLPKYQRKLVERVYFELTYKLRLSLKKAEMQYIIGNKPFIVRTTLSAFLFYLIPDIKELYGFAQFSKVISEVNQELALPDNK